MAKVDTSVKVAIAIAALKGATTKELAKEFDVSTSTVKRSKRDFTSEAEAKLKAMEEAEKKEAKKEAKKEKAEPKKAKPATTKKRTKKAEPAPAPRGYKKRNGRVEIMYEVFAEFEDGVETPTKELLARVNEISVERGLKPIRSNSFYAMLSVARKHARAAEKLES